MIVGVWYEDVRKGPYAPALLESSSDEVHSPVLSLLSAGADT